MNTREFTKEELYDLVEDSVDEQVGTWRHGSTHTYVFPFEGKHWRVKIRSHPEEGWSIYESETAEEVVPVQTVVTQWEPA